MPGRHGKQVTKRGRSKRQRPSQMENTLKDSIRSRCVKERSILSKLIAPKVEKKFANAVAVTPLMPMFAPPPPAAQVKSATAPAAPPVKAQKLTPRQTGGVKEKKAAAVQNKVKSKRNH
jgi:hypothetical protein